MNQKVKQHRFLIQGMLDILKNKLFLKKHMRNIFYFKEKARKLHFAIGGHRHPEI
jgi:hypothetical protein